MRILVPLDGSDNSKRALVFLGSRSSLIGAAPEVHLVNVQHMLARRASAQMGREATRRLYESEAESVLEPARKVLAKAGIAAQTHTAVGHAGEQIAHLADELSADLIAIGAHGYSEFKGLLFGSVTNGVLARTRRAVLVLRAARAARGDALRTGIAVDGSKFGQAGVKFVLRHRELFGASASLKLINVVSDFSMPVMADLGGVAVPTYTDEEIRRLQDKAFEGAVAPARRLLDKAKVKADEVRLAGLAGDQIAAYAKKNLDVLVLGSHGYGSFKAAVLGSVATRIAAKCDTPLLIVRS